MKLSDVPSGKVFLIKTFDGPKLAYRLYGSHSVRFIHNDCCDFGLQPETEVCLVHFVNVQYLWGLGCLLALLMILMWKMWL